MKKVLCTSILFATTTSFAAAITSVNTTSSPNGYQIVFKNASVIPTTFNTSSPASVVLDFPNTTSALKLREQVVNQNGIYSVNVIQGDGRTRAVVSLANPAQYNVQLVGKDLYLTFPTQNNVGSTVTSGTQLFKTTSLSSAQPVINDNYQSASKKISTSADLSPMFHKNAKKGGVLSFTLPNKDSLVSVKTEGSNIVAIISDYTVDKKGQKRLDVADYGSPVRYVDITRQGNNDTKVTLNMGRNAYEYVTYQNGSTYTIEVNIPNDDIQTQKLRELQGFGSNKVYTGAPLSLNFQDIEVRAVLQIIAEFTNNNIVVSDSVNGNITLRLDNVPWDQALDIILKTKSLGMRKQGKVMYIAPEVELDTAEIALLENLKKKNLLQPSHSEMIQLKYAKASDIAKIIEASRKSIGNTNNTTNNEDSILSGKGSVAVDERTNNLIVNDIPSKIQAIRELVAQLDEPVRQVLVDSRLVITSDQHERALGAKFGLTFANNSRGTLTGSGNLSSTSYLNKRLDTAPSINDRLGVSLAASNGAAPSYALSILSSDVLVDLELQALQSEGRSEIISSPRVVTQDGYKALVASGQEIPYTSVSAEGTQTSFKDAKLSMEVTPRIAPNDRVSMEIHITKDSVNNSYSVNGQPPIDTNEINTKVEVDNGETIVLGGIYEQTQSTSMNKVPLLGDIPVIGNAFKNTTKVFNKNELLVFITPRIIDKRLSNNDKFSNLRD